MKELQLIKLANKRWKPLSITALLILVLYLIYRQILQLDIFPQLSQSIAYNVISKLIDYLFILSIIGLVFGAILFILSRKKLSIIDEKWEFHGSAPTSATSFPASTIYNINIYNYFDGIPESKVADFKTQFQKALQEANEQNYHNAIDKFRELLFRTEDNSKSCSVHIQIGHCYRYLRQHNKALEHYSKALHLAEKGQDKEGIAASYGNIAISCLERPALDGATRGSNIRKAVEIFYDSLEVYRKDEYPVQYATTQNNLGTAYTDLPSATAEERAENVRKAIACYKEALEVRRKDEYPAGFAMTIANLGMTIIETDLKEGCKYIEEALKLTSLLPDQGRRLLAIRNENCQQLKSSA